MKKRIHGALDWFEEHINYLIELIAFIGGVFCILFAMFLFVILLFGQQDLLESSMNIIAIPGIIGFFGVIILFALRITRHLTEVKK